MGCAGSSGPKPVYNPARPLANGGDKDVFKGTFEGKPVAVCVAKADGKDRIAKEVEWLKKLDKHPNIVEMLYWDGHSGVLALEAVEPVGFDHDRLVKQYLFANQSVPSSLMKTLIKQLCSAIDHMHTRMILHRDIKAENFLITSSYDAKLIDMGIACKIGMKEDRWVWRSRQYFAPELCQGGRQNTGVDTWGLGLILHQTYQHRWDLLDASKAKVAFRAKRPSTEHPMDDDIMETMLGLLTFDPAKRWTTKMVQEKMPPAEVGDRDDWMAAVDAKDEARTLLRKYRDTKSPLTAYAAIVDSGDKNLIGKKVGELTFREDHNAILLLVDTPGTAGKNRVCVKSPGKDTVVNQGSWLYFGMPPSEDSEEHVKALEKALFPSMNFGTGSRSCNAKHGLMAFTLEFDCFAFPSHIGSSAAIGTSKDSSTNSLNLRGSFGLNLAGIVNKNREVTWFPGPEATVQPGDLGLVVRCPCQDGTTEPTVFDEQLQPMMDKTSFAKVMASGGNKIAGTRA